MQLTTRQIEQARMLYEEIQYTQTIEDDVAEQAYDLFNGIHRQPNFKRASIEALGVPIDFSTIISADFFIVKERIELLVRYVLTVLPYLDLLHGAGKLPINRTEDNFYTYLQTTFETFTSEIEQIQDVIPAEFQLFPNFDLSKLQTMSTNILTVVEHVFMGRPSDGYHLLKETLNSQQEVLHYLMRSNSEPTHYLFKMRSGSNVAYVENEMFHIPFQLRGLVSTNRYSIPGLPCVYLGSSSLVCWEELGRPDLNTVQVNLFRPKEVRCLDISMPPVIIANYLEYTFLETGGDFKDNPDYPSYIEAHLYTWPLICACSIRVKHPKDTFKPEYIVPQFLLQWVRHSNFDGICFFSTKPEFVRFDNWTLFRNYAFPVQTSAATGHCETLRVKFDITNAVPWQTFTQIYDGSPYALANERDFPALISYVEGFLINYDETYFSRIEGFLKNIYNKQYVPRTLQPQA